VSPKRRPTPPGDVDWPKKGARSSGDVAVCRDVDRPPERDGLEIMRHRRELVMVVVIALLSGMAPHPG